MRFWMPGMLMRAYRFLQEIPSLRTMRSQGMSGNLRRCTGDKGIVKAVQYAAKKIRLREGSKPWRPQRKEWNANRNWKA